MPSFALLVTVLAFVCVSYTEKAPKCAYTARVCVGHVTDSTRKACSSFYNQQSVCPRPGLIPSHPHVSPAFTCPAGLAEVPVGLLVARASRNTMSFPRCVAARSHGPVTKPSQEKTSVRLPPGEVGSAGRTVGPFCTQQKPHLPGRPRAPEFRKPHQAAPQRAHRAGCRGHSSVKTHWSLQSQKVLKDRAALR